MTKAELTAAFEAASCDAARAVLRGYRTRADVLPATFLAELEFLRTRAIEAGDESLANAAWCLLAIAEAQDLFVQAVRECQRHCFYDGWMTLERAELTVSALGLHFDDMRDEFGISHLRAFIPRLQRLFPYRVFFSPGFIKNEVRCSICDCIITPRGGCGHRVGGLYNGEMAGRVVKQMQMLEISIVERPVQKYSVLFPQGERYNYALVAYVVAALRSPWDKWSVSEETRRVTDERFAGAERNDPCPCGSGKKFKKCHEASAESERPHYNFSFEHGLPAYVPHLFSDTPVYDVKGGVRRGNSERAEDASAAYDALRSSVETPAGYARLNVESLVKRPSKLLVRHARPNSRRPSE